MKNRKIFLAAFTFILTITYTYMNFGSSNFVRNESTNSIEGKKVITEESPAKQENAENVAEKELPSSADNSVEETEENKNSINSNENLSVSGIVTSVPWENDENFKKVREKNGVDVMMSAYCAVLNDPLPGEEENVHIGARLLCGTIVEPGKIFSQNRSIGPYIQSKGYKEGPTYSGTKVTTTIGGGVCKIASTLYNAAVMSNLSIVERYAHGMPVSYVPYGQDATVSYGSKDFRFKNTTNSSILIWAQGIDNRLYIGFYGKSKPPKVNWHHEILSTKKTTKIYKINNVLKPGEERIIVIGMDGAVLNSWVTIENSDGTVITKKLGRSAYLPLPYIYEKGSNE